MTSALDVLARYGYLVVFGAVFAEQIGLPFPSEPFLLAAGAFAGNGHLNLLVALVLGPPR
jgi:membrane protein DedA with SNARE-associated domain